MSQELLANNSQSIKKRVKERSVRDALHKVREWRRIYEQGKGKLNTNQPRISLQDAANLVNIPKKTLEDYTYIFNKVSLIGRIEDFSNKRMGFLRELIEKNKAQIKAAAQIKKEKKKKCIEVKKEDSFENIIKIEFENESHFYERKDQDLKIDLNQEAKQEIKEEEQGYCFQNQSSIQTKF